MLGDELGDEGARFRALIVPGRSAAFRRDGIERSRDEHRQREQQTPPSTARHGGEPRNRPPRARRTRGRAGSLRKQDHARRMLSSARRQLGTPHRAFSTDFRRCSIHCFDRCCSRSIPRPRTTLRSRRLMPPWPAAPRSSPPPRVAASPVVAMGLEFPNRVGACRGPGQERRPYRRPGNARVRIHRMRHGDAAAAAGQP